MKLPGLPLYKSVAAATVAKTRWNCHARRSDFQRPGPQYWSMKRYDAAEMK